MSGLEIVFAEAPATKEAQLSGQGTGTELGSASAILPWKETEAGAATTILFFKSPLSFLRILRVKGDPVTPVQCPFHLWQTPVVPGYRGFVLLLLRNDHKLGRSNQQQMDSQFWRPEAW